MELLDGLRSTGAVRAFTDQPVDPSTVYDLLETARFAPNGGNRQGWRVVVVEDSTLRAQLRDLYLGPWYEYLSMGAAGLTAFAPITNRPAEAAAIAEAPALAAALQAGPGGFAEHLDTAPVLLMLVADLRCLATTDRDLDRYTMVGGGSIYPFAWSLLLAARAHGLGGVLTTMLARVEADVRPLIGMEDHHAIAGLIALGYPEHQPTKLRRQPVEAFATIDRLDGQPFTKVSPTS